MDEYIKNISNNINYEENQLEKINDIYISKKEKEILDKYNINYNTNYQMLIYEIEDYLNNSYEELPDLEEVSMDIAERNYYLNTNK